MWVGYINTFTLYSIKGWSKVRIHEYMYTVQYYKAVVKVGYINKCTLYSTIGWSEGRIQQVY